MKKVSQLAVIGLVVGLIGFLGGCSNESPTVSTAPGALNLNSEFGGYAPTDEQPAFGDMEMAAMMGEDPVMEDPMMTDGEMDSVAAEDGARVFAVAIRWGMLELDTTVTQTTDWSGSAGVTHGVIHVRRLLRFERGQDYIVRPRPSRQVVEWVSETDVSFDGVLLTVVVPPAPAGEDWSGNAFSFRTGPYSQVFSIDELDSLDRIVDVDELGNQVAFNSSARKFEPCGGGPLEGRWLLGPSGQNGRFFGRWMGDGGFVRGHLRGHFGTRPDGQRVLFGKYISREGMFRGLIRGVWGVDPVDSTVGWFEGVWAGRNGRPKGRLHGRWSSDPVPGDDTVIAEHPGRGHHSGDPREHPVFGASDATPGFFSGRWIKLCEGPSIDSGGGM